MALFERSELVGDEQGGYVVRLHLNRHMTEFASEFTTDSDDEDQDRQGSLQERAMDFVKNKFPNKKISAIVIVLGTMVVSNIPMVGGNSYAAAATTGTAYKVVAGDSLWMIAKRFNTTVSAIKTANNMTTDNIYVGQTLIIPTAGGATISPTPTAPVAPTSPTTTTAKYTVVAGDSLWALAKRFNTTVDSIKKTNNLTTDSLRIGQVLTIPTTQTAPAPTVSTPAPTVAAPEPSVTTPAPAPTAPETDVTKSYTVVAGDSLWAIAKRFNTTVDAIKKASGLVSDALQVGMVLKVPTGGTAQPVTPVEPAPTITNPEPTAPSPVATSPTVSYQNYTVQPGDTGWGIAVKFGIPFAEFLKVNNMTSTSTLRVGQIVSVPVHHIPVKPVAGPQFGELLNWWTEAQYVVPIGKEFRVIDVKTGRSWMEKRTVGANHADVEPLTAEDAAIIKEVWGGSYSWTTRAVIIEVDGRRIAASMSSMPHDVQYIDNNNFEGHHDIHFLDSTRHKDGLVDPYHQAMVRLAAGVTTQ